MDRLTASGPTGDEGLLSPLDPTHCARALERVVLVERRDVRLPSGDARELALGVGVPADAPAGWLRIGVGPGYDDSGDGGVELLVADGAGALVRRALVRAAGVVWHEHAATPGARFVVTLRDDDTELAGLHPGNAATLEVLYEHERAGR